MQRPLMIPALMLALTACQRLAYGDEHSVGSSGLASAESDTDEASATGPERDPTPPDPIDVSRFMGSFHNEFELVPFGREVERVGTPTLANLEILPNGAASMTMETCSRHFGTLEIALRWEARPGPALELFPGPGEDSLRFMTSTDLESVRATLGEGCDLLFELDGEPLWLETYRPGRACWVNRCDGPGSMVHIDYCDGEAPPPCE